MAKLISSYDIEYESTPRSFITHEFINEMLSKINIVDVLNHDYGLMLNHRKGDQFRGHCPFPDHRDSSPSFEVNDEQGLYKCFGCGRAGTLLTFFMGIDGMSFKEAIGRLSELSGISIEGTDNEINYIIRQATNLIDNYINYFDKTDLPSGLCPDMFFKILADRLKTYEQKVDYDPEEIEWVDGIYKIFDDYDLKSEYKKMNKLWNNLSKDMNARYTEYKERK